MKSDQRNFSAAQAERLRHYQGQRLTAADLQHEHDHHTWLRGLHVVGLHNTWGIALGFEPSLAQGGVLVTPGFAYDCFGREIVLSQPRRTALPADLPEAPDGYTLVVRYNTDLGQPDLEHALCCPPADQPEFAWQRPARVLLGREVPLLRVVLLGGLPSIDLDVRRYTQPLARPHVGSGVTPPTQLWRAWRSDGKTFLQTDIDTSGAGFVGAPFYIATVAFDVALVTTALEKSLARMFTDTSSDEPGRVLIPYLFSGIALPAVAGDGAPAQQPALDADGLPQPPGASGFTFRITLDPADDSARQNSVNNATASSPPTTTPFPFMRVTWLGVEPGGSCQSPPVPAAARTPGG